MSCLTRFVLIVAVLAAAVVVIMVKYPSLLKGVSLHTSALSFSVSAPAVPRVSSPRKTSDFVALARQDALDVGISPDLFVRQINQESGFDPNVVGSSGEIGIAQFMPATAAGLGVNPYDPVASLKAAARMMAVYVQRFGEYAKALAAYNAGSGTVAAAVAEGGASWGAYIPASTRQYVCAIEGELCS